MNMFPPETNLSWYIYVDLDYNIIIAIYAHSCCIYTLGSNMGNSGGSGYDD